MKMMELLQVEMSCEMPVNRQKLKQINLRENMYTML